MKNSRPALEQTTSLLRNRPFRRLAVSQFLAVTAVYALTLAGMALVEEQTRSSAQAGLVVLSAILPAFLTSLFSGTIIDRSSRVKVLAASNLGQGLVCLAFGAGAYLVARWPIVFIVYIANAGAAILSQFALPAELALMPTYVNRSHLLSANSLLQLSILAAEGLGVIALAPLLIKGFGIPAVGLVGAVLCFLAAILVIGLPRDSRKDPKSSAESKAWSQFWRDVQTGWQTILHDPVLRLVALQATVAATLLLVLISLLPGLVSRHFGLGAENVPLIVLPGGLGFVIGSILISRIETKIRRQAWIAPGLIGGGLSTAFLALFGSSPGRLPLAAILLFCLGFCLALVIIPARTVLQERPPAHLRGRVISAQLAMGNAAAVLPLLLGGSLADRFGILPVMGGLGLLCILVGLAGLHQTVSPS